MTEVNLEVYYLRNNKRPTWVFEVGHFLTIKIYGVNRDSVLHTYKNIKWGLSAILQAAPYFFFMKKECKMGAVCNNADIDSYLAKI